MSFEYLAAAAVGLLLILFLGLATLVAVAFVVAKLTGGRSPVGAPVDPVALAAAQLVSVVDSGRHRGAMKVIDRLADHEGETFVSNVAAGVAPKAGPPAK